MMVNKKLSVGIAGVLAALGVCWAQSATNIDVVLSNVGVAHNPKNQPLITLMTRMGEASVPGLTHSISVLSVPSVVKLLFSIAVSDVSGTKQKEGQMKIIEHCSGAWNPGLSEKEKSTLFAIAQDTLKWCVERKSGKFPMEKYELTPKLKTDTATFVTLKIKGELRGCIGSLAPVEALYISVHHNAVSAALHDYRFNPVSKAEVPSISVDVSILSPIRDIPSLEEFKLGQQGIILGKGMNRAVFLPEVALEQKWTKEETLTHLALKAGLDRNDWKSGAHFQVFESMVLSIADEK